MALHDVREVAIALALDQPRTVKFDLNAFAELEEIYGSMDKVFAALQTGSMKAARTLLWAGLLHEDESLTEKQIGKLVTMDNMEVVMDVISKALLNATPQGEADEQDAAPENPT